MNYYTSIIILCLATLSVMCVLISENDRIPKADRRHFYLTYLFIALSALAEWTGLKLDGVDGISKLPLMLTKCADYILTPMAGGTLILQMNVRNRWSKTLEALLAGNTIFQIVACFGGWMIRIDEHNHYSHGPLYWVYICFYLSVIAVIVIEFLIYGKAFSKQNRASLYAIIALIVGAIATQELLGSEYRISYIALTIGAALLYIHYSAFTQIADDDKLHKQDRLISTDALTGLMNRYSYAKTLKSYEEGGDLPKDLCAFSIDINGLKKANDTLGHAVGDELICGAAECIRRAFWKTGKCFRTGGDEFIVFAELGKEHAEEALARLKEEASGWVGEQIKELNLAAGYASAKNHPGISAEKLVIEADRAMYAEKKAFYRDPDADRRRH